MAEQLESSAEEIAEHAHHSALPYYAVWGALVALTFTTFLISRVNLGWGNLPIALAIASTKAGLVVWFFMHLRDARGLNRVTFFVSLGFFALLFAFTILDVTTRYPPTNPPNGFDKDRAAQFFHDEGVPHHSSE